MADETRGAGGFMPPRAAIPVAGPGVAQPGDSPATAKPPQAPALPAPAEKPLAIPRLKRKLAPKKKAVAKGRPAKKAAPRKAKARAAGKRPALALPYSKQTAAPAGDPYARIARSRRGGPDLAKVMNVLGNAKRKDAPVINAVVQALSAVSRPARGRVLQAVTELFFG